MITEERAKLEGAEKVNPLWDASDYEAFWARKEAVDAYHAEQAAKAAERAQKLAVESLEQLQAERSPEQSEVMLTTGALAGTAPRIEDPAPDYATFDVPGAGLIGTSEEYDVYFETPSGQIYYYKASGRAAFAGSPLFSQYAAKGEFIRREAVPIGTVSRSEAEGYPWDTSKESFKDL